MSKGDSAPITGEHSMNSITRITIGTATLVAAVIGTTVTATPAEAAANSGGANCISMPEKDHLRLGSTPAQVRTQTHANPWFRMPVEVHGTTYFGEVFNDCRTNSGKAVIAIYSVNASNQRHLMMARYYAI
jgi:hypothetical protein